MASYVENSIVARNDLPLLSSQTLEMIEKLDAKVVQHAADLDRETATLRGRSGISKNKRKDLEAMSNVAEMLSERKAQVAVHSYDLINQNINMVDHELKVLEKAMRMNGDERLLLALGPDIMPQQVLGPGRRGRRPEHDEEPVDQFVNVDPNEPVYCTCRHIAYGDMVACDNDECAIEWFHYACVNLTKKPSRQWLCPECSRKRKMTHATMR